jgi:hypothetical protein
MLQPDGKDLHPPHGRFQADYDEGVHLPVLILLGGFNQAHDLVHGKVGDPPCILLKALDFKSAIPCCVNLRRCGEVSGNKKRENIVKGNGCASGL